MGLAKRWIVGLSFLLLALAGATAWFERTPLTVWYCVFRLIRADDTARGYWLERTVRLEETAVPGLLTCLQREDPKACVAAETALDRLAKHWAGDDSRVAALASRLVHDFARFSRAGRCCGLDLESRLLHRATAAVGPSEGLLASAVALTSEAAGISDKTIRARGLALANVLLKATDAPEAVSAARELTRSCLRDRDPEIRIRALQLASNPHARLLVDAVSLLHDPVAEVRRAALLAVGPSTEAVATDDLLPWLHDADAEVRRLCETALQGRGLQSNHIKLAKLITDERPRVRLEVLGLLSRTPDLDAGVWLRRLSQDPVAAVRAAALRAAAEQPSVNFSDRTDQMSRTDPSPTVRQLAHFYLSSQSSLAGR
jgi:hypothetical protein